MNNCYLILLLVIIITVILLCNKSSFDIKTKEIEEIKNPYIKSSNKIKWYNLGHLFMKSNWPNEFTFDYKIKKMNKNFCWKIWQLNIHQYSSYLLQSF